MPATIGISDNKYKYQPNFNLILEVPEKYGIRQNWTSTADTTPFEKDFGFKPATPLREYLHKFAEWYAGFSF